MISRINNKCLLYKFHVKSFPILYNYLVKSYCVGITDDASCIQECSLNWKSQHNLTINNMNQNIRNIDFVLKKQLLLKAHNIELYMKMGKQYPFGSIIKAYSGDMQALGHKPLTFVRQVLAVLLNHDMMYNQSIPKDVIARAGSMVNYLFEGKLHSCGTYTGLQKVRMHVAEFLKKRDGYPSNWENIFISSGSTIGVRNILNLFTNYGQIKPTLGIMVPVPMFPLLSPACTEHGLHQIKYYLEEQNNWSINARDLEVAIEESKKICIPKIIVVVNPGNPTGQVLSKDNIQSVIKFAKKEKLFIIALEDYQNNIYMGQQFHSFRKVMNEMGNGYKNMEIASFFTISKGYLGECGIRGSVLELSNVDPEVKNCYERSLATSIHPSIPSQAVVDILVKPPEMGDPSYNLFTEEKQSIMEMLDHNAKLATEKLNSIKGYKCNPVQGSMYAFPRINFSIKAILAAERKGREIDEFYAMNLLQETGVFVIPGSGFGQWSDTYHIRITILPPTETLNDMMEKIQQFHLKFIDQYGE